MGFLQWKNSKTNKSYDDKASQRASSVTLPRKPDANLGADEHCRTSRDEDGPTFLIKASHDPTSFTFPATPERPITTQRPSHEKSTAEIRTHKTIYRSASVVVGPTTSKLKQYQSPLLEAGSTVRQLVPDYNCSAQFAQKVELYKGSISTVYKAQCLLTKIDIIIKQYIKAKMSSRSLHKMKREIRLMRQLEPMDGVAQILGDFEDQQFHYIIMEHCSGGDLYHRMILKGEFEEHWACQKVIIPLLRVLDCLHREHQVVHRDIKPENIFLTKADELRLGDFGLAIKQDEELPFLRAGTLDYMAPEVLMNDRVDQFDESPAVSAADLRMMGLQPYDHKVDVWAVGVLAFELLIGEAPFYDEDAQKTKQKIKHCDDIPFPCQLRKTHWADFVRVALQKNPKQRPTAVELLSHPWILHHTPTSILSSSPNLACRSAPLGRVASLSASTTSSLPSSGGVHQSQQSPKHMLQDAAQTANGGVDSRVEGGGLSAQKTCCDWDGTGATSLDSVGSRACPVDEGYAQDTDDVLRCLPQKLQSDIKSMPAEKNHQLPTIDTNVGPEGLFMNAALTADPAPTHQHPAVASYQGRLTTLPPARHEVVEGNNMEAQQLCDSKVVDEVNMVDVSQTPSHMMHPSLNAQGAQHYKSNAAKAGCGRLDACAAPLEDTKKDNCHCSHAHQDAITGDVVDLFAAQRAFQGPIQQTLHGTTVTSLVSNIPSTELVTEAPGNVAVMQLPGTSRPKSYSLPKSAFASKSMALFRSPSRNLCSCATDQRLTSQTGISSCNASQDNASAAVGMLVSSTAAGSKVPAACGKRTSRLSVSSSSTAAAKVGVAASTCSQEGTRSHPGKHGNLKTVDGPTLRSGSAWSSSVETLEDLRNARPGSINRLKLYLSRQRGF